MNKRCLCFAEELDIDILEKGIFSHMLDIFTPLKQLSAELINAF